MTPGHKTFVLINSDLEYINPNIFWTISIWFFQKDIKTDILNILICEDERLIALDLQNSVRRMGHSVVGVCHTGQDLIELTKKLEPGLILTDISLKGDLSGIDAIKIIQCRKSVPFIYVSGLKDEHTYNSAMQTKPCAFIAKPFYFHELKNQIENSIVGVIQKNKFNSECDKEQK